MSCSRLTVPSVAPCCSSILHGGLRSTGANYSDCENITRRRSPKFGHNNIARCRDPTILLLAMASFSKALRGSRSCKSEALRDRSFATPVRNSPFLDMLEASPARNNEMQRIQITPSFKPQALMRSLVRASLPLGKGMLLDPFMGAGSTIAAAKWLGLNSVGVELDPKYFAMAKAAIPRLTEIQTACV